MTKYLCLLVQEYEAVAGMAAHLPSSKRTFGHDPFFREGESPREVLSFINGFRRNSLYGSCI
ncbi:hypothetical protein HYX12_01555 [Candidatus Woesearchaeota archaeon]|nr:hypothetical protein [Candidatus Woesearchaeota archaeon]